MSRSVSRRLLAQSPFAVTANSSSNSLLPLRFLRPFSITQEKRADADDSNTPKPETQPKLDWLARSRSDTASSARVSPKRSPSLNPKAASISAGPDMGDLANAFEGMIKTNQSSRNKTILDNTSTSTDDMELIQSAPPEPHHFHIYATRHNTHITLTDPNRNPQISLSCGNIGFRHSGRKHYDSAYQLASLVMARMQEKGINNKIEKLEVILRGFGAGREAVTKALLGSEGRLVRNKIIRVTDATRLKFGGTRSKKPRRLG